VVSRSRVSVKVDSMNSFTSGPFFFSLKVLNLISPPPLLFLFLFLEISLTVDFILARTGRLSFLVGKERSSEEREGLRNVNLI